MDSCNKYFSEQEISHKCCLRIRDFTNRRDQWPNIHRMDSLRWVTSPEWFPNQPRKREALLNSAKFQCGHPYGGEGDWYWELSHTVHSTRWRLSNSPSPAKCTTRDPCLRGIWSGLCILYLEYNVYPQTLIVTGGSDEAGTRLDSTEVYNLDSTGTVGAWREVGRLPSARCQ